MDPRDHCFESSYHYGGIVSKIPVPTVILKLATEHCSLLQYSLNLDDVSFYRRMRFYLNVILFY